MDITLTPDLETFVHEGIKAGRFLNADVKRRGRERLALEKQKTRNGA